MRVKAILPKLYLPPLRLGGVFLGLAIATFLCDDGFCAALHCNKARHHRQAAPYAADKLAFMSPCHPVILSSCHPHPLSSELVQFCTFR